MTVPGFGTTTVYRLNVKPGGNNFTLRIKGNIVPRKCNWFWLGSYEVKLVLAWADLGVVKSVARLK